ncbi:hypothetical protein RHSIM_Rhsim13G0051600 [Rhododendron simsii]|uniref:Uncharacterized protein n=1 Tax=Rhododendron simsii TaxID=118357 RepID=A0A834FXW2_RHOSS|nr:hypothetical protein RHSIM_Rhsim13G0051600 [Rhododendron simsii]
MTLHRHPPHLTLPFTNFHHSQNLRKQNGPPRPKHLPSLDLPRRRILSLRRLPLSSGGTCRLGRLGHQPGRSQNGRHPGPPRPQEIRRLDGRLRIQLDFHNKSRRPIGHLVRGLRREGGVLSRWDDGDIRYAGVAADHDVGVPRLERRPVGQQRWCSEFA